MAREDSIERFAVEEAESRWGKDAAVKWGLDGWPDRQILPGGSRHFWMELKNETGRIRKAQIIRAELLERKGDHVYFPRTRHDIRRIFDAEIAGEEIRDRDLRPAMDGNWRG